MSREIGLDLSEEIMDPTRDLKLKHLETIQSTIDRLAQNSFTIKGWSITLVSVVFALLATQNAAEQLILIALIPALIFWGLDAFYLRQERLYRKLYEAVAQQLRNDAAASSIELFTMNTRSYYSSVQSWARTLFSKTVLPIPLTISLITLLYWFVNH